VTLNACNSSTLHAAAQSIQNGPGNSVCRQAPLARLLACLDRRWPRRPIISLNKNISPGAAQPAALLQLLVVAWQSRPGRAGRGSSAQRAAA